jgi:hypothetical protein
LSGKGTIVGDVAVAGIHAPGNSPGIQAFTGNLSYAIGGVFVWDLNVLAANPETNRGVAYDGVDVTGNLSGSGAVFRVQLDGSQDLTAAFWDINRQWSGIYTVSGTTVTMAQLFNGGFEYKNFVGNVDLAGRGVFSWGQDSDTLTWTANMVPEPSFVLLGGLSLGICLLRRNRRQQEASG